MIGAPPADKEFDILAGLWKPDGRPQSSDEEGRKKYVMAASSYKNDFPIYGKIPPANIKPKAPFSAGWAKFGGQSEAMRVFDGSGHEAHYEKQRHEKTRVKDY